ncbi:Ig domain-containing protein [Pyxidicoccus sp. 3LFB2]
MRRVLPAVLGLLCVAACTFAPDLSRYAACDAQGGCPSGFSCLALESRCVPDCAEGQTCGSSEPDADGGDAGADAGVEASGDAGLETDAGAGDEDAGADGGDVVVPLSLDPYALVPGHEGAEYSSRLLARGGTPPYRFTAMAALPPGFTMDGEGHVTGTPVEPGNFFLPVSVTDQSTPPQEASGSIRLQVRTRLWLAGPGTLAAAPRGQTYEEQLSAVGGTPPYHFTVVEGALPVGLQLAGNGKVTGTSTQAGKVDFTVKVMDSASPQRESTRALSISTVAPGGLALTMMTQSLPDGRVRSRYEYTLRLNGGTGPYAWRSGSPLPPGLSLDSSSGILSGLPTEPGEYPVHFILSDLLQSRELRTTLVVD